MSPYKKMKTNKFSHFRTNITRCPQEISNQKQLHKIHSKSLHPNHNAILKHKNYQICFKLLPLHSKLFNLHFTFILTLGELNE